MWTNICTTGICLETFLSDAMKWDHFTGSLRHFCIISFSVSAIRRVPNGTMHTITMVKMPQFSFPFFWTIHILRHYICTVTDLANSCATPLFRLSQGSLGCLEKRNHPLSWNLGGWSAKIGLKTKKLRKTIEKPTFLTDFGVRTEDL